MKTFSIIFLFLVSVQYAHGVFYVYKKSDGSILKRGRIIGVQKYDTTTTGFVDVSDSDSVNKEKMKYLRYSEGSIVKVNPEQEALINKVVRRKEIRYEIRELKQQYLEAMSERAEGFDVSQETTTIRAKLEALKAEYQSLQ